MKARHLRPLLPALAIAVGVLASVSAFGDHRGARAKEPNKMTIRAAELANAVIGDLGVPLGTIVLARGMVATRDPASPMAKEDEGVVYFMVTHVDGRALPAPARVRWDRSSVPGATAPPLPGLQVDVYGYETGAFEGAPEGTFKHVPAFSTAGFHFATRFVALRLK